MLGVWCTLHAEHNPPAWPKEAHPLTTSPVTERAAKKLPAAIRRMLEAQCDGEWDRVTVTNGVYTVHNNFRMAHRACLNLQPGVSPAPAKPKPQRPPQARPEPVPPAPPTPPPPAPVQARPTPPPPVQTPPPAPESRREKTPQAALIQEVFGQGHSKDGGGVKIVSAPPKERVDLHKWTFDPDSCDWSLTDFDKPITKLRDELINGLPDSVPFQWHADVLALGGMNLDMFEAAIRHPQRVEIRPETRTKKYPVLAFHRGDATAIVGFRTPTHPMCIAIYAVSKLDPDMHTMRGGNGGGGARKTTGLPKNVRAMIKSLRQMGAEIDYGSDVTSKCGEVKYKNQCLGKVSVAETTPRQTVQSDYQRTVRRMNAIDARTA